MTIDVSWRTLGRVLLTLAAVALVIALRALITVVLVAVVLAVALDPVVAWLEARRWPRSLAATVTALALVVLAAGALALGWSSLAAGGRLTIASLTQFHEVLLQRFPIVRSVEGGSVDPASLVGARGAAFAQSLARAALVLVFGFILMVYLLVDGTRTYRWLRSFVPRRHRGRVDESAAAARRAIASYARGNVLTSLFAAGFVFAVLALLRVPAALVLALIAGLCDFVPVLGFIVSVAPAILLALTVGPGVAVAVFAAYVAYHFAENYVIGPKVYGRELRLSDTAVLLAFAVGAELGGVVGALVALPIAATYPCIEQIWLSRLMHDTVEEHHRIERMP